MGILSGLNIVITGGSHGIGEAIVRACAREGANILFTYCYDKEAAQSILATEKNHIMLNACKVDLSESDDLSQLVNDIEDEMGAVDIFINNAGVITRHDSFLDIDEHSIQFILDVNLKAPFVLTQAAAKNMIKHGKQGKILNISSMSAEIISTGLAHYECSKSALNTLTKSAASDLAKYGICVNAIAPGLVATHMNEKQRVEHADLWMQRCEKIPLKRAGTPQEIASLALFLISPLTSWITGSIFRADGGQAICS